MNKVNKYKLPFLLPLFAIGLAGCSQTPLIEQLDANQLKQLDKVYQLDVKAKQIAFVVVSNGCTSPLHFGLKQQYLNSGAVEVALIRYKKDRCRAMPRPFSVSFELEEKVKDKNHIKMLNPKGDIQTLGGKSRKGGTKRS